MNVSLIILLNSIRILFLLNIFNVVLPVVGYTAPRTSQFPNATMNIDLSPEYMGVGYVIGPRIAGTMVAGAWPPAGETYTAVGCERCLHTGYRGRTGIYELLRIDDGLRRLIHDRASEQALREHVRAQGMRALRDDGMRWVVQGVTSLAEVVRVTRE